MARSRYPRVFGSAAAMATARAAYVATGGVTPTPSPTPTPTPGGDNYLTDASANFFTDALNNNFAWS